jgi:hypothetical protein
MNCWRPKNYKITYILKISTVYTILHAWDVRQITFRAL